MKKILFLSLLLIFVASCSNDDYQDVWATYAEWRNANDEWLLQQMNRTNPDGTMYYRRVTPAWNPNGYVLMHWFNDTIETSGNLVPLYTSTVSVKYIGKLYNDTVFDSSFNMTDSIFTTTSSNLISGWVIALANMHVGDTCEVVVPYQEAYYTSSQGLIPPFSCLTFGMKLVDIPYYELKP